jgi:exosome complex component RRP4
LKRNKIAVPGEVLAKGVEKLPGKGTYRHGNEIRAKQLGLVRVKDNIITVVPLAGVYIPKEGDKVVAQIIDVQPNFWVADINSYRDALLFVTDVEEYIDLSKVDLTDFYDVGDTLYAKVRTVSKRGDTKLTMRERICRKLHGGNVIQISPVKVPRLIGKGGSMIDLIKKETGCQIMVGQNGLVWLKGKNERLAIEAIQKVDSESHIAGLTDRIKKMLEKEGGKK